MSNRTKAGRRESFREHCTGAKRRRTMEIRAVRSDVLRSFGAGHYVIMVESTAGTSTVQAMAWR